jgi:LAO/AO transport system kinase
MFIRSMATRGSLGGLAQATGDTSLLLDAAGKDIIFIETVGVGQAEIEVVRLAHCTLVLLVPGMGDDVQSLKAGLMEIGDIFALNKSDHDGADRYEQQLTAILHMAPGRDGWSPPVVRTVASEDKGIDDLVRQIGLFRTHFAKEQYRRAREIQYWKEWLLRLLQSRMMDRVRSAHLNDAQVNDLAADIAARKQDPYTAVNGILSRAGLGASK